MYQLQCQNIQYRKETEILHGNAFDRINEMDLINQFLKSCNTNNGYGFFECIDDKNTDPEKTVVEFSKLCTRRHWKGWRKFGAIPITFKNYLETKGISTLVNGEAKKHDLISLYKTLESNVYRSQKAADFATKILNQITYEL